MLPEDAAIAAAHPTITGRHRTYAEAARMVRAKHSKPALIDLVNWLLSERDAAVARADEAEHELGAERMARDELAKEFGGHREAWGKLKWEMKAEAERLRKDAAALRSQHVDLRVAARAAVEALEWALPQINCRHEPPMPTPSPNCAVCRFRTAHAALRKCLGE